MYNRTRAGPAAGVSPRSRRKPFRIKQGIVNTIVRGNQLQRLAFEATTPVGIAERLSPQRGEIPHQRHPRAVSRFVRVVVAEGPPQV